MSEKRRTNGDLLEWIVKQLDLLRNNDIAHLRRRIDQMYLPVPVRTCGRSVPRCQRWPAGGIRDGKNRQAC